MTGSNARDPDAAFPRTQPTGGATGSGFFRWNEEYLSSVNVTTDALSINAQDCTFVFSVENWISNHDMRIIPEVDLGMSGRPTWWLWTADDGRNMVLRLGPESSDVEQMLQAPHEFSGAQACGKAGSGNETCMVFGKLDGARIVSFTRPGCGTRTTPSTPALGRTGPPWTTRCST